MNDAIHADGCLQTSIGKHYTAGCVMLYNDM